MQTDAAMSMFRALQPNIRADFCLKADTAVQTATQTCPSGRVSRAYYV